jgi:hypothetical protein
MDVSDAIEIGLDDVAGVVLRAVVYEDDLEVGVRLRERAVQRLRDERGAVVARDDDRDERFHGCVGIS